MQRGTYSDRDRLQCVAELYRCEAVVERELNQQDQLNYHNSVFLPTTIKHGV